MKILTFIICIICILFTTPVEAKDYWVYVRTYDRPEIKIGELGGRSKKGDVIETTEVGRIPKLPKRTLDEWLCFKVDIKDIGEFRRKYLQPGTSAVTAYRRWKVDLDTIKSQESIVKEVGEVSTSVDDSAFFLNSSEKTALDISRYYWQSVKYALINRPILKVISLFDADPVHAVNPATIDTDGGGDYLTLNAWEDAEDGVLAAPQVANCTGDTEDTTATIIDGWTTSAANYIDIVGTDTNTGIWNASNYTLHNNDSDQRVVFVREAYIRFTGIQFKVTSTAANEREGLNFNTIDSPADAYVDSCFFLGVSSSTGTCWGIFGDDVNNVLTIYNSIFTGFINGADTTHGGVYTQTGGTYSVYSSTFSNNYYGFRDGAGTTLLKNSALFNNTDDHRDIDTVEYNATDDDADRGNNGQDFNENAGNEWTDNFTNYAAGIFTLKTGGICVNNGTNDPSGSGYGDPDIADTARAGTWDIGAFELVTAAVTEKPRGPWVILQVH